MGGIMKISIVFAFVFVFAAALSNYELEAREQGEELVTSVCDRCHSLSRVCRALENESLDWTETIRRMRGNGAPLDAAMESAVSGYLSDLEPGSSPVCR